MKKHLLSLFFILSATYAYAIAEPVVMGYLSTNCTGSLTSCFIPYSNTNPMPIAIAGSASSARSPIGNQNSAPFVYYGTTTSRFINISKRRMTACNTASWSNIQVTNSNWTAGSSGESSAYATLIFREGIQYNGVIYPVTYNNGQTEAVTAGGANAVSDYVSGLTLPPCTAYYEMERVTYPLQYKSGTIAISAGATVTGGTSGATGVVTAVSGTTAAGSLVLQSETGTFIDSEAIKVSGTQDALVDMTTGYNQISTWTSHPWLQEGMLSSNNSATDYHAQAPVIYPTYNTTIVGGTITNVAPITSGSGWSAGATMNATQVYNGVIYSKSIGYGNMYGYAITVTASNPVMSGIAGTGIVNGSQVILSGTTAPTGFTLGKTYYAVNVSGNNFSLSATSGGAAITPTTTGTAVTVNGLTSGTITDGTPFGNITVTANNATLQGAYYPLYLVNGQAVVMQATVAPTGFTNGTTYYVVNVSGNGFGLSATNGGTAITPTSTGTNVQIDYGLHTWNNPTITFGSGGSNGFGSNSAIITASLISGIPSVPVNSITIDGDSIARGDCASDNTGDMNSNTGLERALNNQAPDILMARCSALAYLDSQPTVYYPKLYGLYMGKTNYGIVEFGSNDFAGAYSHTAVEGYNLAIANYMRSFGLKVTYANVLPRTTGTSATLEAAQTPTAGFTTGGEQALYNADLKAGVLATDWGGILDQNGLFKGTTNPQVWASINGIPLTYDFIHESEYGWSLLTTNFASFFSVIGGASSQTTPISVTGLTASGNITSSGGNITGLGGFFTNLTTGNIILNGGTPTVSAGTISASSTSNAGSISGLSAATTETITFNSKFPIAGLGCSFTGSTALASPAITAISTTAVTVTMTAFTGTLYYQCF